MTSVLLIVNADDYGLTERVSAGILRSHYRGIVTSTSLLVTGPAFQVTSSWLLDTSNLGIGVHLAAVGEDPPVLSAKEIPTLVNQKGQLSQTYKGLIARLALGAIDPSDIEREFTAQLEMVYAAGLTITHLDAHQHVHLWPQVREIVLKLAIRHRIPAVRVTRSRKITPVGLAVDVLGRRLARAARSEGIRHPTAATGFDQAGNLDEARLLRTLSLLAGSNSSSVELTVHPGEAQDPDRDRYRWGYRWADELAGLTSPAVMEAVTRHGFRLGSYADLALTRPSPVPDAGRGSLAREVELHPVAGN